MQALSRWAGKTALVTGASSGIGAATARLLAAKGMRVLLTARRAERLNALAREIEVAGGQANAFPADLEHAAERERLAAAVQAAHGCPDVLVNNAGFGWYGYFAEMPWETAGALMQVNVVAPVHLTALLLPEMLSRRWGMVVNVSSIAGGMPNQGVAVYAASKAFLNSFTSSVYRETRGSGVQVCAVLPGPVASEFFTQALRHPQGRAVPAEGFAVPPERVAGKVWSVLRRPRRFAYVPGVLGVTPWLEWFFGWAIDLAGPLLLRREK